MGIASAIGLALLLAMAVLLWITLRTDAGDGPARVAPATSGAATGVGNPSGTAGGAARAVTPTPAMAAKRPAASEPPAGNFEELLARYSPAQQKVLKASYGSYDAEMMKFSTPEQLAWLKRRGFPMPEDVLAAKFLSDEQLKARADAGDAKAAAFLAERWMHRTTGNREAFVSGPASLELALLQPEVVASGSPFGGYFYARAEAFKAPMQHPDNPHMAKIAAARSRVVGLAWAGLLGDGRADGLPSRASAAMLDYYLIGSIPENRGRLGKLSGTNDFRALMEFITLLKGAEGHHDKDLFAFVRTNDPWPRSKK